MGADKRKWAIVDSRLSRLSKTIGIGMTFFFFYHSQPEA